jgi:hypothetical protein
VVPQLILCRADRVPDRVQIQLGWLRAKRLLKWFDELLLGL